MKAIGYQVFIMIELARIAKIIDQQLEYDTTWELGEKMYSEFENSEFDNPSECEIECIEKFLLNYNKSEFETFLLTCEKVDKNTSEEYVEEQLGKGFYNLRLNNEEYWVDGNLYTITNDDKLILNIGNGKTKILSEW